MERKETIGGEEFVIRDGSGGCVLEVVNGDDVGRVTWHNATQRYRGAFNGWGTDADSVEGAVKIAAGQIIETRKGVSQKEACEAMGTYLKG